MKASVQIVYLPCLVIFRAFYKHVFQTPVAHSAKPHLYENFRYVTGGYFIFFQEP